MTKKKAGDIPVPRRVVVVGAGIAGLTAAHELAERGYEVEVVESEPGATQDDEPAIGGMARTTWAVIPTVPLDRNPAHSNYTEERWRIHPPEKATRLVEDQVPAAVLFTLGEEVDSPGRLRAKDLAVYCAQNELRISVVACFAQQQSRFPIPRGSLLDIDERDRRQVAVIARELEATMEKTRPTPEGAPAPHPGPLRHVDVRYVRATAGADRRVQVSALVDRVPGEHGFRFFPSFYRHLFDTMKRIPLAQTGGEDRRIPGVLLREDSARTVFDNLTSAEGFELGVNPRRPGESARTYTVPRRPLESVYEVREFLANVLERAGYRGSDIVRLGAKYFEYLTSSPERRMAVYETMTWSHFLGFAPRGERDAFSSRFKNHVQSAAQALVAMSTDTNDARTIGSIALQLTLDQARYNGYSDGTLNGPTTVSFLWPWRDYLLSQGVRFSLACLVGFEGQGAAVRPVFGRPRAVDELTPHPSTATKYDFLPIPPADYYVLTVPVDRFQKLFRTDTDKAIQINEVEVTYEPIGSPKGTRKRIELLTKEALASTSRRCLDAKFADQKTDVEKYLDFTVNPFSNEEGAFRNMVGIQFFFDADVLLLKGHSMCQDSPWGVSYLSQAQYWQDSERGEDGYRGVISAIFTQFHEEAVGFDGVVPKKAIDCNPDEIASRVWRQINDAWDVQARGALPSPRYYFLDPSLEFKEGRLTANRTPYLINRVEDWKERGGRRLPDGEYVYDLQFGHTVFAGAFMRTATRLNTMEAANESARRAVNAILTNDKSVSPRCRIWNPEQYEVDDLRPLQELDRRVYARGGKHFLCNSLTEPTLRAVPWALVRLALPLRERKNHDPSPYSTD